jgi:hypothetical protein
MWMTSSMRSSGILVQCYSGHIVVILVILQSAILVDGGDKLQVLLHSLVSIFLS